MYKPAEPKRRQFFKIATAGTVASAAGGLPMMFVPNAALAEDALGTDTFNTLVKIARDIFPHDRFDDEVYKNAVGVYGEQAKSDEAVRKLIQEGVAQADSIAQNKFNAPYAKVSKERDRVHVLQSIEATPFFKKIRGDLVVSLYNQPVVWAKLGYQGPSAQYGGYINRGFNDQNWMDKL